MVVSQMLVLFLLIISMVLMNINSVLGHIWIYLYPLLLISTALIVLFNLIGFNLRGVYWFKIFSIVFISFTLGSFIYYLYQTYSISNSYIFFEVIKGFYYWAVFLTFYTTIISFIIMAIYYLYQKNKQVK